MSMQTGSTMTGYRPNGNMKAIAIDRFGGIGELKLQTLPIGRQSIAKLNHLIKAGPFKVHIGGTFSPEEIKKAHRALDENYLGKIVLTFADTSRNS